MVEDTVEYSGCNDDVGKDLVPLGKGFVGGKNGRGLFIASGKELKEEVGPLDIQGKATNLVNDEHLVLGKDFQLIGRTVLKMF